MLYVPKKALLFKPPGFSVNAVDFDGTNDYLTRGAEPTGLVDGTTGILSFWFRLDGGDGTLMMLLADDASAGYFTVYRNAANKLRFEIYPLSGGPSLIFRTSNSYTADGIWRHCHGAWNTNFSAGNKLSMLKIDGVSDKVVDTDGGAAFNINYAGSANYGIGANTNGADKFNGCLAEFFFAANQYSTDDTLFRTAGGKPENLGVDGSAPTATAPTIYLNDPAATFGTNKGTGGNFTITGTLDTASTSPSD